MNFRKLECSFEDKYGEMMIGLAPAHRIAGALRANGHESEARRHDQLPAVLCRAFSPRILACSRPSPLRWAGIGRAFGPKTKTAGANRIIILPRNDFEATPNAVLGVVRHRRLRMLAHTLIAALPE